MNADLTGILPVNQPYNVYPWEYTGTETFAGSFDTTTVVDWVLVEYRDAADVESANFETSLGGQAALLLNDGSIVDIDGTSNLTFYHLISQQLFVVIWHRNHLPVVSKNALSYLGGAFAYDFTASAEQAYGDNQSDLGNNYWGMIGGDANADGTINDNDGIESWYPFVGKTGYFGGDVNMDIQVNNQDKNDVWYKNNGKSEILP